MITGKRKYVKVAIFVFIFGFSNILYAAPADDSYSVDAGATLNEDVLSNDDSGPNERNFVITSTGTVSTSKGTYTLSSNGTLVYTANSSASGTDTFDYQVMYQYSDKGWKDATGSATVTITINAVTPTNTKPIATTQSVTTSVDTAKDITLAGSDADDDTLTYTIVDDPSNGTLSGSAPNVIYTPNSGYQGSDSFTFKVNDGTEDSDPATVSITIDSTPASEYPCSKPHAFEKRHNVITAGDLVAIGNSNICADDNRDGKCDDDQQQRNDVTNIIYTNRYSSSMLSGEPSTLMNVSSASLNLPSDAKVLWAGLYWHGEVWNFKEGILTNTAGNDSGTDGQTMRALEDKVQFKVPGSGYAEVTADEHYYFFLKRSTNSNKSPETYGYGYGTDFGYDTDYAYSYGDKMRYEEHYQGFKDVTSDLQAVEAANGTANGEYWIGNIQATVGKLWYPGVEAAWTLQVVYEYPNAAPRSITVNDGYVGLYGSASEGDDYANDQSCSTGGINTGVYAYEITFDIDGLLTPKTAGFTSDMTVFVTESDPDATNNPSAALQEKLSIQKTDGTWTLIDGPEAWNYEILDKDGNDNLDRKPDYIYPIGVTIKNYTIIDALDTEQIKTTVKFETDTDRLILGVIGFATDLRKPNLCYDYGYSQYDRFFTEDNDGSEAPRIVGAVDSGAPVDVRLYIRNTENSDVVASDLNVNILDINDSQAIYIRDSTYITEPNTYVKVEYVDVLVSDTYIKNIYRGELDSNEYFYVYYSLDPSTGALDIPLNARVDYTATLALPGSNGTISIPYKVYLNEDVPMCTSAGGGYEPQYREYNIEQADLFDSQKYNLRTQVAKRADNFKLVSYDVNDSVSNIHTRKSINTVVAIELIDVGAYHDAKVSCTEPDSSISERVWISLNDSTNADFTEATILANVLVQDPKAAEDFYSETRENVAFRMSYPLNDDDGTILVEGSPGSYKLTNFTVLATDPCVLPVTATVYNNDGSAKPQPHTYTRVPEACGNNSGNGVNGMSQHELNVCMECIFGSSLKYVCSRDNFALRPEAFSVKIHDDNETNSAQANAIPDGANIAAGYTYRHEINATTHVSSKAAEGYRGTFSEAMAPNLASGFKWTPMGHEESGCNNTDDTYLNFKIISGDINVSAKQANVGRYSFYAIDKLWTSVDQAPIPGHSSYPGYWADGDGDDCYVDSEIVNVITNGKNKVGCDISSDHNNTKINVEYNDRLVNIKPYSFNLNSSDEPVEFHRGLDDDIVKDPSFVYMNTLSLDANMSARYIGSIQAVGADGNMLSNYVDSCFAESIELTVNTSDLPATPVLVYRLLESDFLVDTTVGAIIRDTSGTSGGAEELPAITVPTSSFTKNGKGQAFTALHLNFDRLSNTPINPIGITYGDFDVDCSEVADCASYANLQASHEASGKKEVDKSVVYLYGRAHAPRRRVMCSSSTAACTGDMTFYYEFYADSTLTDDEKGWITSLIPLDKIQRSIDSVSWYRNSEHNESDGGITATTQSNANIAPGDYETKNGVTTSPFLYAGDRGFPYKNTVRATSGVGVEPWLIYDAYNANATVMSGHIEFYGPGKWTTTGDLETHSTSGTGKAKRTNRRIRW